MSLKHFKRHNKSILQEVIVDEAVENVDSAVIRGRSKQSIFGIGVEIDLSDGSFVISQGLVRRLPRHVHVKPEHLLVIGSQNEIVSFGVHRNRGNPFGT